MVMPALVAELCPQCGADARASGTRCQSCGFYLPAAPSPRTGPPMARPLPLKDDSRRTTLAVLVVGGVVVLGLVATGTVIALREPAAESAVKPVAALTPSALPSPGPARLETGSLFAEAKRQASAWHRDAVLVSVSVSRADAGGVAPDGSVEFAYARPSGQRFTGGAETGAERLRLRSSGAGLTKSEERAGKGRVAPEPNCSFEDAWSAAQQAGAAADGTLRVRYAWSDKHERPVWEAQSSDGEVLKRVDGVSCSILTR